MAMKNYREPQSEGNQKKLLIALAVLAVIFLFTYFVWPGFMRR